MRATRRNRIAHLAVWVGVGFWSAACSKAGDTDARGGATAGEGGAGVNGGADAGDGDGGTGGAGAEAGAAGGSGAECAGCTIGSECVAQGLRNPDNACEACDPARSRSAYSALSDTSCDDGAYCTVGDACSDGVCRGEARSCDDGIQCNGEERCDENLRACAAGVGLCPAELLCNAETDECGEDCGGCVVNGTCYAPGASDPRNPCRICDLARSSSDWSNDDGAVCDDESFCTEDDRCGGGSCAGTMIDCGDGVACNGQELCNELIDDCNPGDSPCSESEVCNVDLDVCEVRPECGNGVTEAGEACDDGVNDGEYGGCAPGCLERAERCGDGSVQGEHGELCDGNCPTACTPLDACDQPSLDGSAESCDALCTHQSLTACSDGDGCCPGACNPGTDDDCTGPVFDVEVWVDNQNNVSVSPTMLEAPFNSYARIRWHNVGAYQVWIVNFGSGSTWSQLAILGPGQSTTSSSLAEGPWCAYDFGGTYRLGGLYYPTEERAILTLRCVP